MTDADPYQLQRFVTAQQPVFPTVLAELQAGHKRTHWMWFIFPQLRGLGFSPTAQFYGITSLAEAQAYLAHPELGPRLEQCTRAVLGTQNRTLHQIFGSPDDLKFCSSMALFAEAACGGQNLYREAIDRFCEGRADQRTLDLLRRD